MHHHSELSFVDEFRWVSPLHYKNGWQNAVHLWCMLQAGPPSLHYYCAVVLHSCIVLPPVGHCVSNFYCTFKVFIWLSLLTSVGRSQVYLSVSIRSSLFWVVTQHMLIVVYRHVGRAYWSQRSSSLLEPTRRDRRQKLPWLRMIETIKDKQIQPAPTEKAKK